jgi:hypothetical protein
MDQLGIGFLSMLGMPPVEFIDLAADFGCRYISTSLGFDKLRDNEIGTRKRQAV